MQNNLYLLYFFPLVLGFLHGLLFATLLIIRGVREERPSDLLLAALLVAGCLLLLPTLLGILDIHVLWNEWLFLPIDPGLLIGPLLFLFVLAHTNRTFRIQKRHLWHFTPFAVYAIYHFVVFAQGQVFVFQWMDTIDLPYINPIYQLLTLVVMSIYLAITVKHYRAYRRWVASEYANPESHLYPWITRFLWAIALAIFATCLLRLVEAIQLDFDFIQSWLTSTTVTICIYYISISGYISTRPPSSNELKEQTAAGTDGRLSSEEISHEMARLTALMEKDKAYLDPELSLGTVAKALGVSREVVSVIINSSQDKNFRGFVNTYRVEAFKKAVAAGEAKELTLFGLALDCGFNSKATFNRVFKQIEQMTPNAYATLLESSQE